MIRKLLTLGLGAALTACSALPKETATPAPAKTMGEILAAAPAADWRSPEPENTLYLELKSGRVILELAPDFAPRHASNLRQLAREHYFDGLAIMRSQDNFVVQWGDPDGEDPAKRRSVGKAAATLPAEFTRSVDAQLEFIRLPDADGYAPQVGFSQGFPAARNVKTAQAWLSHCYAMVGAGRGNDPDSGGGTELYVVTGHAPRQLDRNITLVGRVIQGMELLSTLPRGTGPLGFYEKPEQRTPIISLRLASELPAPERTLIELLRTDSNSFAQLIAARRNRRDDWYKVPAGYIDLCSVPLPARKKSVGG